jgi:hypothetical protein
MTFSFFAFPQDSGGCRPLIEILLESAENLADQVFDDILPFSPFRLNPGITNPLF